MRWRPRRLLPEENSTSSAADAEAILQVKIWLLGISPMVWRRVLVPATFTLRELHGVIQVAIGWEGILMVAATISIVDHEARWSRPQDAAEMAVQIMVAGAREHLDLVLMLTAVKKRANLAAGRG